MLDTTSLNGLVGRPHALYNFKVSDCDSGSSKLPLSIKPIPWAKNFKGLDAATVGSSCLKLPAAAFLGLAKVF